MRKDHDERNKSLMEIAKSLMVNMGIVKGERLLVLCDDATQGIGDAILRPAWR